MRKISAANLVKMAMTEQQGLILRKEIEQYINTEDYIILDFSGISLFATMFFNASIGYYVKKLSPEGCKNKIKVENISDLGQETYNHSFENAKGIFDNSNEDAIAKITLESIEDI